MRFKEIKRVKRPVGSNRSEVLYTLMIGIVALLMIFSICRYVFIRQNSKGKTSVIKATFPSIVISDIPAYSGEPFAVLNDNKPYFDVSDSERGVL